MGALQTANRTTSTPDAGAEAWRTRAKSGAGGRIGMRLEAGLTDNELRRYRQQHPEEGDIVTGFFQRAREEGIEQGIERGIEEGIERGRAEGERTVLQRLLEQRFGELPPETAERLRRASGTVLETWADNVLEAKTLDEVFGSTPRSTGQTGPP